MFQRSRYLACILMACSCSTVLPPLYSEVLLFDALLGGTPRDQGWPFFADPLGSHSVTQVAGPQFTTLDSRSPMTDRGGYFSRDPVLGIFVHPNMPVTDRFAGYSVRLDLRIEAESHATGAAGDDNGDGLADRAGFSLISISQDLRGIEVAWWQDSVWAQDDDTLNPANLFTQAENAPFDTVTASVSYRLEVLGDRYRLMAGPGIVNLLTGRLRDYTNFMGSLDPYQSPSFLFFGDNTTRGEAAAEISRISIDTVSSACEQADALVQRIATGTQDTHYDLTGDGLVNQADLARWLDEAGDFYLGSGRDFLPGDANLDGAVDGSDFGVWNSHKFTAASAWCSGDFSADGFVDGSDFSLWNAHKFQLSIGAAVPEPSGASFIWLVGWLIGLVPRRRGNRSATVVRNSSLMRS